MTKDEGGHDMNTPNTSTNATTNATTNAPPAAAAPPAAFAARIVAVKFHAPDTGFTIANVVTVPDGELITVKGTLDDPHVSDGIVYNFHGKWEDDPQWGRQFAVASATRTLPADVEGIRAYLESHCSYIGKTISQRLVDEFGADTLRALREEPETVAARVGGLTSERAARASEQLVENADREAAEVALNKLLAGTGVGPRLKRRMIAKFGAANVVARVQADPYELAKVRGIGFLKADVVARVRCGVSSRDPRRVRAAILYAIDDLTRQQGHVAVSYGDLIAKTASVAGGGGGGAGGDGAGIVGEPEIAEQLRGMWRSGEIVTTGSTAEDVSIYIPEMRADELSIAENIHALLQAKSSAAADVSESNAEVRTGLADDQLAALDSFGNSNVFVLTGGPGTGKTYTLDRMIRSFAPGTRIELAAPTGKAAKRMNEMTGRPAKTIHRLLGLGMRDDGEVHATIGAYDKIAAQVVVVDEFSMCDNWLAARLLCAIATGTRLIIVGDQHQLPSVGPGNVLRDVIASGAVPCVELTSIKRQKDAASSIIKTCHSVKVGGGLAGDVGACDRTDVDLHFVDAESEADVATAIVRIVQQFVANDSWGGAKGVMRAVQVISPLRERSGISCAALNGSLQNVLNGARKRDDADDTDVPFRIGDKVIQTRNDYGGAGGGAGGGGGAGARSLRVANGEVGYVESIYFPRAKGRAGKIVVNFESADGGGGSGAARRSRRIEFSTKMHDLELAYAVTCHKYQGSEADVVIIPVHRCFGGLVVQRSWLYTALSRGKRCVVLVGSRGEFEKIVARVSGAVRRTGLVEALKQ